MSGVSSTSSVGSVTPSRSIGLSGQAITCGQGQFADRHGVVSEFQQGSLAPDLVMAPLAGQSISVGQGSVTVQSSGGDNVTVHISGVVATFAQDAVIVGPTQLVGSATTSADGSVTPSGTTALTGSEIASATGTVSVAQDAEDTYINSASGTASFDTSVPLVGTAVTTSQGTVSSSANDQTVTISAESVRILSQDEDVSAAISVAVTGQGATFSQGVFGAPGVAALTGSSVAVEQGFLGRSFPIGSGQEITSATGTIVGLPGIVALVGQGVSVEQGDMRITGTNWTEEGPPTTSWIPTDNPNSSWVRKGGPSTGWTRK